MVPIDSLASPEQYGAAFLLEPKMRKVKRQKRDLFCIRFVIHWSFHAKSTKESPWPSAIFTKISVHVEELM